MSGASATTSLLERVRFGQENRTAYIEAAAAAGSAGAGARLDSGSWHIHTCWSALIDALAAQITDAC
jgi:hypothetical protein